MGTVPSCTRAELPGVARRGSKVKGSQIRVTSPESGGGALKKGCTRVCRKCTEGAQRVCGGVWKGAQMGPEPGQSGQVGWVERVWWVQAQYTKRSKKSTKGQKCACFDRAYHEKST